MPKASALVAQQVDAQRFGGDLAVADGDEGAPHARGDEVLREQEQQNHQDEAQVVEPERLVDRQRSERQRGRLEASGAEGDALPMQEHPLRGLREGEGGQGQVEAAEAQCGQRYGEPDGCRDQGARRKRQPERPAELHLQQTGRVGADAEHGGVGEGELAGVAEEDIEADRQQHIDDDEVGDEQMIEIDEWRQHDRSHEQRQEDIASAEERHATPSAPQETRAARSASAPERA